MSFGRSNLSVYIGVALLDKRIIIPRALCKIVLNYIHSAIKGITGMPFRANHCIQPGLDLRIRNYREFCVDCNRNAPTQQPGPLLLTPSPLFQQIYVDYF